MAGKSYDYKHPSGQGGGGRARSKDPTDDYSCKIRIDVKVQSKPLFHVANFVLHDTTAISISQKGAITQEPADAYNSTISCIVPVVWQTSMPFEDERRSGYGLLGGTLTVFCLCALRRLGSACSSAQFGKKPLLHAQKRSLGSFAADRALYLCMLFYIWFDHKTNYHCHKRTFETYFHALLFSDELRLKF